MSEDSIYTAYLQGSLALAAEGIWFHNGTAITHPKVQRFLHRHLTFDSSLDCFTVAYGKGRAVVSIERTPYFITELTLLQPLQAVLASGDEVPFNPEQLQIDSQGLGYYLLPGEKIAGFGRSAWQSLVTLFVSETKLEINGKTYSIRQAPLPPPANYNG